MSSANGLARRRWRPVLALTLALAFVLVAGCQSAVEHEREQQAGGKFPQNCRDGGTLAATSASAPQPQLIWAQSAANVFWARAVFEPLVTVEVRNGSFADPEPMLARSWRVGDDDRTLVLKLRKGVSFHTGRSFTADDVIFTFRQALSESSTSSHKQVLRQWEIDKTGRFEVTIRSDQPLSPVFADVLDSTPIVDRETYDDLADGSRIVGTGPFRVRNYDPGATMVLKRNDDYWQDGLPRLDRIENEVIEDPTAQVTALQSGRVQLANDVTVSDAQSLTDRAGFGLDKLHEVPYSLMLDPGQPGMSKRTVRQAIGYAIDAKRINQQVFGGMGTVTDLIWPRGPLYPRGLERRYEYDPERAKRMLKQAGATGTKVDIATLNIPRLQSLYEILANNLREVGLRPSVDALPASEYATRIAADDTGNYLSLRGQVSSPSLLLQYNADVRLQGADRDFESPRYNRLGNRVIEAGTGADAKDAVRRLGAYMLDEAFQHVLVSVPAYRVRSSDVGGTSYDTVGLMPHETCLLR